MPVRPHRPAHPHQLITMPMSGESNRVPKAKPPPATGMAEANCTTGNTPMRLTTTASSIASHAALPACAHTMGSSTNAPMPMTLPTTMAVAPTRPILRCNCMATRNEKPPLHHGTGVLVKR
jgi:hypothetical protein